MNKFFLLIFIIFCALIFYQGVLSKNGLMEKFTIEHEKEKLNLIIALLQNEVNENDKYIDDLKKNPKALEALANELGFFQDDVKLLRIVEDFKRNEANPNLLSNDKDRELLIKKIKENNQNDAKINKTRMWVTVVFYSVFGFFIILTVFGSRKNEE